MLKNILLAVLALSSSLMAQNTMSYRVAVPVADVYSNETFTVPQFSPFQGTLTKVEVWTNFVLEKQDAVEALCTSDDSACVDFDQGGSVYSVTIRVAPPLNTFLSDEEVLPGGETVCADGPFDGVDDFMGPSSALGPVENFPHTGTPYAYPLTDLSLFTGPTTLSLTAYFNGISFNNLASSSCADGADYAVLYAKFKNIVVHIRYTYI